MTDVIDEIMPDEADQASFALGLLEALRVIAEHLPEGAIEEIRRSLMFIRENFEGPEEPSLVLREIARKLGREHLIKPRPEPDEAASLAVGMIDYWLREIRRGTAADPKTIQD